MGGLISGQLLGSGILDTAGLFQYAAGVTTAIGLALWICYHAFGKKYEKVLVAKKQALLKRAKEREEATAAAAGKGVKEAAAGRRRQNVKSVISVPGSWGGSSLISTKF